MHGREKHQNIDKCFMETDLGTLEMRRSQQPVAQYDI